MTLPPSAQGRPSLGGLLSTILLFVSTASLSFSWATAQDEWELRVCASLHNPPASSREAPGYDNRIAEILADELGARLTFEWTLFDDESIQKTLLAGECDLAIGVADGAAGMLSTVPYLRTPYVFVQRSDSPLEVTSLDDDELAGLRIGTYQTGIPSLALRQRGLEGALVEFAPVPSPGGPDRHTAILDAVLAGDVDLGIVYAPAAAHRAAQEPGSLVMRQVQPEVDIGASLIQHFTIRTIGVRPHDHALRDRLNAALAERWDDVRAAIDEYGVPQLAIARPSAAPTPPDDAITRVGVIVPAAGRAPNPLAPVGEPARLGATLAENAIARHPDAAHAPFQVLLADAPTDEAAIRAAGRLVATEEVDVLVGGFGLDQARALAAIAEERDAVFFNVGAIEDELRGATCNPRAFHVQASAAMYLDATLRWYGAGGTESWFVIHEATEGGTALFETLLDLLEASERPAQVVGSAAVDASQLFFLDAVRQAGASGADAVLLLLPPQAQELVLSQLPAKAPAVVAGLPHPLAQTREYLFRFRDIAPAAGQSPRASLWEASIEDEPEGSLNGTYLSRTGLPMEGTAWATYTAVMISFEAARAGITADTEALVEFLTTPGRTFDTGKGPVGFRPEDHQLLQPLYMVQVDPEARWTPTRSAGVSLARSLGRIPAEPDPTHLDTLGGEAATVCKD